MKSLIYRIITSTLCGYALLNPHSVALSSEDTPPEIPTITAGGKMTFVTNLKPGTMDYAIHIYAQKFEHLYQQCLKEEIPDEVDISTLPPEEQETIHPLRALDQKLKPRTWVSDFLSHSVSENPISPAALEKTHPLNTVLWEYFRQAAVSVIEFKQHHENQPIVIDGVMWEHALNGTHVNNPVFARFLWHHGFFTEAQYHHVVELYELESLIYKFLGLDTGNDTDEDALDFLHDVDPIGHSSMSSDEDTIEYEDPLTSEEQQTLQYYLRKYQMESPYALVHYPLDPLYLIPEHLAHIMHRLNAQ